MDCPVVVAGLYGMSLLLHVQRFPAPGETVAGEMLALEGGGKGFNQAISVARNGARTTFFSAVGEDEFGRCVEEECKRYGMSYMGITMQGANTATAAVLSDEKGESRVIVAQGACGQVDAQSLDLSRLPNGGILLLQNELPEEVNLLFAKTMKERGGMVIYNPAPVRELDKKLLRIVDYLVPNWGEALALAGMDQNASPDRVAKALQKLGVQNILITLGDKGVLVAAEDEEPVQLDALPVQAVDTTGAGDTFCGALAAGLAKGKTLLEAVVFANGAAALSVTRKGVSVAIPTKSEVEEFLARRESKTATWKEREP